MWNIFLHRRVFCGMQPKATWSEDQCEGVPLVEKYKNCQRAYVHKPTIKKPLELKEKWKKDVVICIIFHAYFTGLHWLSYGTLSEGLESIFLWTIMAVVTVNVSTTWTLCATWVVLSAFRIAHQLCRILCLWTVSKLGALHIFSRHPVTNTRISMPLHFIVRFHSLLVSESLFPRIIWVIMKSWKPAKLEVGFCGCLDDW